MGYVQNIPNQTILALKLVVLGIHYFKEPPNGIERQEWLLAGQVVNFGESRMCWEGDWMQKPFFIQQRSLLFDGYMMLNYLMLYLGITHQWTYIYIRTTNCFALPSHVRNSGQYTLISGATPCMGKANHMSKPPKRCVGFYPLWIGMGRLRLPAKRHDHPWPEFWSGSHLHMHTARKINNNIKDNY